MATVIRLKQYDPLGSMGKSFGEGTARGIDQALQEAAAVEKQAALIKAQSDASMALFKDKEMYKQEQIDTRWAQTMDAVDILSVDNPSLSGPVYDKFVEDINSLDDQQLRSPQLVDFEEGPQGVASNVQGQKGLTDKDRKRAQDTLRKQGLTVRFDKNLGSFTAVPIKTASALDYQDLQNTNAKLTIDARIKEQTYLADKAAREGERYEHRKAMIENVGASLTDERYTALFPKGMIKDEVARESLAAHLVDNFPDYTRMVASVDRQEKLFVRTDATIANFKSSDYATSKKKGYEPYDNWISRQKLLYKSQGGDETTWVQNEMYKNRQFLSRYKFDKDKFAIGTPQGDMLDKWRTHEDNGWIAADMNKIFFNADELPENFTPDQQITQQINLMAQADVRKILKDMSMNKELTDVIPVKDAINAVSQSYMQEMLILGNKYGDDRGLAFADLRKKNKSGDILTTAMRKIKGDQSYVLVENRGKGVPGGKVKAPEDAFKMVQTLLMKRPGDADWAYKIIERAKTLIGKDPKAIKRFELLLSTLNTTTTEFNDTSGQTQPVPQVGGYSPSEFG